MTDKEIIKALECHEDTDIATCKVCPYDGVSLCGHKLCNDALDLINRQQAEIERLEIKIEGVQEANAILREHIKKAIKEFAERLKEKLDCDVHTSEGFYFMVSDTIDNLVKELVGDVE